MSNHLSRDDFAAQLNSLFAVDFAPETVFNAELIEVSERREMPRREVFSLIFLFPPDAPIVQRLFTLRHETLGSCELFLVPIGRSDKGTEYEALFNRLLNSPPNEG